MLRRDRSMPFRILTAATALAVLLSAAACGGGGGQGGANGPSPASPEPPPTATFTFAPATPVAGEVVQFADGSTGSPSSFAWSFGDGGTSPLPSPSHAYASAGTFTVALVAANTAGASAATRVVTVVAGPPAPTVPGAPSGPSAAAGDGSASLSWSAPASDGGSAITGYAVLLDPPAPSAVVQLSGTTATVAGLANGTTYTFQARARNAIGEGPPSPASAPFTPAAVAPGAPFHGTVLLGAPTATSVKVSLLSPDQDGEVALQVGTAAGLYDRTTPAVPLVAGEPTVLLVSGLLPDTRHHYRISFRAAGAGAAAPGEDQSFHTARPPGSSFTFTVQADSHLDENTSLDTYLRALANVRADAPDFHVDLGDTFMCEKSSAAFTLPAVPAADEATVVARYRYERDHFGLLGASAPLFLVNGNHEGEAGWLANGTAESLPVWASKARQRFYPTPVPDAFYGGDAVSEPFAGQRAAWYAFTWGDALFVVLDPFWSSATKPGKDGWSLTLGARQYQWLEETLAGSAATFKFVFVHNLVGGLDGQMRGGVEAAPYFEWGGKNADGTEGFATHRPGWAEPIHALLVRHGVTAVFHGHDHLYARQELDGIVYQEVPQPSALNPSSGPALAAQYHYAAGTILSSSGHLRVSVGPAGVKAEYVRTWLPLQETGGKVNGQVDDAWIVTPSAGGGSTPPAAISTNVVLGRPTASSVAASVLAAAGDQAYLEYGTSPGLLPAATPIATSAAGEPLVLEPTGLPAATRHWYRVRFRPAGASTFRADVERTFTTAPARGTAFVFGVQGDSHPERAGNMFAADLYALNMQNVAARRPDLYFMLGDDFSIEALLSANTLSATTVDPVYRSQRSYAAIPGHSTAFLLVNGNHEQAARYLLDTATYPTAYADAPILAAQARLKYFALPAPDAFYAGDSDPVTGVGLLRDYYAFEWGDALFVVLDPYWHSKVPVDNGAPGISKVADPWLPTIGDAQYEWLRQVLEGSTARFKFVFEHHVLGTGRGAARTAHLAEWGGWNQAGKAYEFRARRPTWAKPIHQLFRDAGVTIFFGGHDHLYAREILDGVVYQSVPNPADDTYTAFNADAYGPATIPFPDATYDPAMAVIRPNSGFLQVTVGPAAATVDYVRAVRSGDEARAGAANGEVSFSYTVAPR